MSQPMNSPLTLQPLRPSGDAPYHCAPEKVHHIYAVTLIVACVPILAGIVFYGWRAAWVAALAIFSCAWIEKLYYRVRHTPALFGRTHGYLTGVLLAMTLPATTPWFIIVLASAFAILIGKAVFGGVGHFLWQPALVGRVAVAILVPALAPMLPKGMLSPDALAPEKPGVLMPKRIVLGDVTTTVELDSYHGWRYDYTYIDATTKIRRNPLANHDAFALPPLRKTLAPLTRGKPQYSALAEVRETLPGRADVALPNLLPLNDVLLGARGGGIGETSIILLFLAGLYLVYRHYIKLALPMAFLGSAAIVAAIAPIQFLGPNQSTEIVWNPLYHESFDVGLTYVVYQVLSGPMVLAAFFLASEMTTRPVTTGGQVLFGVGCGVTAMLLQLYVDTPIPVYLAVLGMNTFSPTIDAIWRPRVFGQRRFAWLHRDKTN